jgi:RNA polymerase sigma factor (sigma-70 family)
MATPPVHLVLRHVRKLTTTQPDDRVLDHQLLERFTGHREEAAFAALVRRHGPLVLGVCRSVLRHEQDAEDAFQATFLVFARQAASIQRREALGSWLYKVAYHVALKARAQAARRRSREREAFAGPPADPLLDMTLREVRAVLYEELRHLPERYRAPLILCYLEGKTQEEAARLLGWTKNRVRGRLERGRERLRGRLTRRGLAPSAAVVSTAWARRPWRPRCPPGWWKPPYTPRAPVRSRRGSPPWPRG